MVLLGAWLGATRPALADAPYTNPVIGDPEHVDKEIADPFVLKWNGDYYLYCSGDPIRAFHSTDLVHWEPVGAVLASTPEAWNSTDLWAPEVLYQNGKFYMYYTAARKSNDWKITENSRRVGVAVSDSPRGPFVDSGQPLTPYWAIDGDVFRDPSTGNLTMFSSHVNEQRLQGAAIVCDSMPTPTSIVGAPNLVIRGTEAWEDKDGNPHNGSLRYTNEGPTALRRYGHYYLMYSGGSWDRPSYSLAYASGSKLPVAGVPGLETKDGNEAGTDTWTKVVPPLLRSTRWVEGPGHNTMTVAPNNVDDICLYHARGAHSVQPSTRLPFADRLYWNHDRMRMDQPSLGDLPAPDHPMFEDRFEHDGALSSPWQTTGDWAVKGGEARGESSQGTSAIAKLGVQPSTNFVLEANVRTTGVAGLTVAGVEVMLDYPAHTLRVGPSHFPLSGAGLYHQLLVTKNGNQLTASLDGVVAGQGTVYSGPAAVALSVQQGWANFDGVALTRAFEDSFETTSARGWQPMAGNWTVQGGAYQAVGDHALTLKGDASTHMEATASLRWHGAGKSAVGIALSDGKSQVSAAFDHDIWPFAKLQIATPAGKFGVTLPRGFLYDSEHTLRVVRQDEAFTFYLDGRETAATYAHLGPTRVGLFADGAPNARWSRCAMKQQEVATNLLLNGGFETEQLGDDGSATVDNPWKLTGNATVAASWSHSGDRRLALNGGSAQQTLHLKPGSYCLHAWGSGHGSLILRVGGQVLQANLSDDTYARQTVNFVVSSGGPVELQLSGDGVAVDDCYLFQR
jgi:GH43 family beta-xylosidase